MSTTPHTVAVDVHHAEPMRGRDQEDSSLVITVERQIPDMGTDWRERSREVYQGDATLIGTALVNHLPGGTLDRLLVFLLEHRASSLRVSSAAVVGG